MAEEHGAPSTDINTREVLWKIEDCKIKEWKDTGHSKASIEQKSARLRRVLEPLPYNDLVKRGLEFLRNSPSARFAIWSANTSRKRSLRQVCGLYALAMLVCTWVLCLAPQAFQSWEKASLFPETYTWDEPNHHELDGRGPTADSECVRACKSAGEDVGSHHLESFCAAVQASWNTSLESRHHCNVCSRCLLVPCPRSHRAWQAWIPLPAARAKIRPRRRMVPPRLPLQMFFSSRIVASSCFRRQPRVSLKRYSNRLQRLKLHTSPKQTSTWKSLSNTIR